MGDIFAGLDRLELGTDVFLPLFLPPLLFTAGLTIDVRRLFDEVFAVLLMAIVAVLVCIAGVAGAVHLATGIDIMVCLLLGAIVSTTDPAAVIGIFRDVGAPKRLSILAEGESLFNDAVAIAAFGFFMGLLVHQADPATANQVPAEMASPAVAFVREFLGGIVFGFVLARVAMLILPRLGDSDAAIASVTVSLAYASYVIADHYLDISGVVCRGHGGAHRGGLRAHAPASPPMGDAAPALDAARVLEQLPDLHPGLDAGGQRAAADQLALCLGAAGGRRSARSWPACWSCSACCRCWR